MRDADARQVREMPQSTTDLVESQGAPGNHRATRSRGIGTVDFGPLTSVDAMLEVISESGRQRL